MVRYNRVGLRFNMEQSSTDPEATVITHAGKQITVFMSLEDLDQRWYNWQMKGLKIQDAFRELSSSHREFFQTGITPEEWEEIFKENDE